MENSIDSEVIKTLCYRQNKLTILYNRTPQPITGIIKIKNSLKPGIGKTNSQKQIKIYVLGSDKMSSLTLRQTSKKLLKSQTLKKYFMS